MRGFRTIAAAVVIVSLPVCATAQSLTEAAKKEKERRESLKDKTVVAVTNADLAKIRKKPAFVGPPPANPPGTEAEAAPARDAASQDKPPADLQTEGLKKFEEKKIQLENSWKVAKEMVELLTLKMNALWQQFYSFNSMTQKDQVQRTISETYQRLQAAQAEEAKAKEELDRILALGPKEKYPTIK